MKIFRNILKSTPAILASIIAVVGITYAAGSLTAPSGTPTNTSYTLQDIYNLASGATTTVGSGSIPSTPGSVSLTYPSLTDVYTAIAATPKAKLLQTFGTSNYCANSSGVVISCTGTGEDGEFNAGIARSYTDNGNGTVSDNNTGLMWQKCPVGLSGASCGTGTATGMSFATATSTCAALSLGGQDDWRVPNFYELLSLYNFENATDINLTYFPGIGPSNTAGSRNFWTSTNSSNTPSSTYTISFSNFSAVASPFAFALRNSGAGPSVRCVRGGL